MDLIKSQPVYAQVPQQEADLLAVPVPEHKDTLTSPDANYSKSNKGFLTSVLNSAGLGFGLDHVSCLGFISLQ